MENSTYERNEFPNSSTGNPPQQFKSQSTSRKNAQWNARETRFFVEAYESFMLDGHKNGKCFSKHGWQLVVQMFNSKSGHTWTKQQLKNRWDALRQKHNRFERLINCSGVAYNDSTGMVCADEEWWERKIKENKDYKEFKDKDCREIAAYKVLFGDAFDADKYAVTPTKLCRTGFAVLEDSGYEDHRDSIPVDIESSASSDEPKETHSDAAKMNISGPRSGDKRKSSSRSRKGKTKKFTARDLSYSCDRATSASEMVAAKIENFMGTHVPDQKTIMNELLETGRLEKGSDFYFWTCNFLLKRPNREMVDNQDDANMKFALVEWNWNEYKRRHER